MVKLQRSFLRCFAVTVGLIVLLVFSCASLFPKDKKEAEPKNQTIFRIPVNIVVVNATVTDKDGNPVTDLTSKDFKVYDDGNLQEIQTFALESYGYDELEETTIPVTQPSVSRAHSPKREAMERNAERPGRMISLVIDDLTMETVVSFPRMIEAMKQYVIKDMGLRDQVAILSASGRLQVPFSDNKQQLLDELALIYNKLNLVTASRSTCPRLTDLEAWGFSDFMNMGRVDRIKIVSETIRCLGLRQTKSSESKAESHAMTEALRQNWIIESQTCGLLYTLRQHIRVLRHFEGVKTVVLFSDGFIAESETPAAYQLQECIDLALRSGIVLNAVSIRGVAFEGQNGLNYGIPEYTEDGVRMQQVHGVAEWFGIADEQGKTAQESPLFQMASDTGGTFSHSRNNLYLGIQEIARRQSYYYILSYGLPSRKADGSYHRIRLELTRPDLKLSYRKGYYIQKEELKFENNRKEDILDALNAPGNMSEIPMTLAYNYSQEDDSTYSVSFITKANIRGLQFLEEDARRKNTVSLILAAFDETDKYINGVDKSIEFRLLEDSYSDLRDRGLTSRVELKLPMGHYKIKAVVRENNQGKMGSVTKSVEIP